MEVVVINDKKVEENLIVTRRWTRRWIRGDGQRGG